MTDQGCKAGRLSCVMCGTSVAAVKEGALAPGTAVYCRVCNDKIGRVFNAHLDRHRVPEFLRQKRFAVATE